MTPEGFRSDAMEQVYANFGKTDDASRVAALEQQLRDQTALVERLRGAWYRLIDTGHYSASPATGKKTEVVLSVSAVEEFVQYFFTPASAGAERRALVAVAEQLNALIAESEGVAGLHRNGDVADWQWLVENEWLSALAHLNDVRKDNNAAD